MAKKNIYVMQDKAMDVDSKVVNLPDNTIDELSKKVGIPFYPTEGSILVYRNEYGDFTLEDKPTSVGSPTWGTIIGNVSNQTDLIQYVETKEPLKGDDDFYVDSNEKITLASNSGTNTGDQDLSDMNTNTLYRQIGHIPLTEKEANGGVATLGADGKVPASQLTGVVPDVIDAYVIGGTVMDSNWLSMSDGGIALTPASATIYLIISAGDYYNHQYRWSGSSYAVISASLALGTSEDSAYRGDHGLIAYDHVPLTNNPHSVTYSLLPDTPFSPTQEDRLKALVYENATSTLTRNPSIIEYGTDTNILFSWNTILNDDTLADPGVEGTFDGNTVSLVGDQTITLSTTTTKYLYVILEDSNNNIVESAKVTEYVPLWRGISTNTWITEGEVYDYSYDDSNSNLDKTWYSSEMVINVSAVEALTKPYAYFLTNKSSAAISESNGFPVIDEFTRTPLKQQLSNGTWQTVYQYKSNEPVGEDTFTLT